MEFWRSVEVKGMVLRHLLLEFSVEDSFEQEGVEGEGSQGEGCT